MGRFFEALKAGVKGFKEAPASALLNTRLRSAFNVDWTDPSATILVCAECGRIEWFVNDPTETSS